MGYVLKKCVGHISNVESSPAAAWMGVGVVPAEENRQTHQDDLRLRPGAVLRLDTFTSMQGFCELNCKIQDFFLNSSYFYHKMALLGHGSIKFTPWMS